ncbi:hypothetical protein quinque_013979 [Culex quinquefasciatus]
MEPNSDGGLEYAQTTARRRPLRADPIEVPLNFFESEQERWFQHVTIENVIKERMAMGPGNVAGPSSNATINSCGIDKAMAVYTEIRSKQYYKFWTRKIARKLRILVLQVIAKEKLHALFKIYNRLAIEGGPILLPMQN